MNIANHLLAGAIIAVTVKEPLVALPLALTSHFVMDALPHYGYKGRMGYTEALKHRMSYISTVISVLLCIAIAAYLLWRSEWLALYAGLIAMSPDFVGIWNYLAFEKHGKTGQNIIAKLHVGFHRRIQWCERPWGLYIEIITFSMLITVLVKLT